MISAVFTLFGEIDLGSRKNMIPGLHGNCSLSQRGARMLIGVEPVWLMFLSHTEHSVLDQCVSIKTGEPPRQCPST